MNNTEAGADADMHARRCCSNPMPALVTDHA